MSQNTFGIDTAFPPPPQPPVPGWPPQPPGPPPAGPNRARRRRWPIIVAAGVVGAVVASVAAATITVQARDSSTHAATQAPTPITVTVAAPTPASPAPLPTAQADIQTCKEGFLATDAPSRSAREALATLPPGMKVLDPEVQQNPTLAGAVRDAGQFYIQASEALAAKIAPGTTPVLFNAANTMVKSLQILGDSYTTFDPIAGNAHEITDEANGQMIALCTRLAP